MFDQNGLSLDQAPPITVVLRFFILGALFGIGGGALMAWQGTAVLDPTSAYGRIMTHILTLGVMLSFMLGALFQMLPVIAGVSLQAPQRLSATVQIPMTLGILTLLWGFATGSAKAFVLGGLFLGIALLPLIGLLLWRLVHLKNHSASSRGMGMALFLLLLLVLLGLYLSGTLGGLFDGEIYGEIRMAHFSFGLFGWIALLIIAISFQVVEMFYVTPSHPDWMRTGLGRGLAALLVFSAIGQFWLPGIWRGTYPVIAILFLLYATITLRRFHQRKRPLTDATVWFWRLGLGSLILSLPSLAAAPYDPPAWLSTSGAIFFAAFAISILFGMLYKIIPFLTWFHLNAQGYLTAPMMHEVIHPKTARKHLYIHSTTLLLLLGSFWLPFLASVAGMGIMISFGWLLYQILHADLLYRHTQRTGQKFEMPPRSKS